MFLLFSTLIRAHGYKVKHPAHSIKRPNVFLIKRLLLYTKNYRLKNTLRRDLSAYDQKTTVGSLLSDTLLQDLLILI